MRFLLDTHVLLWALADAPELGVRAREEMHQAEAMFVSAASIWEAQIKAGLGKLALPDGFLAAVAASGFSELVIDWESVRAVQGVELPHRDPFDRLLVAQARCEQLQLLTADRVILESFPALCIDARR